MSEAPKAVGSPHADASHADASPADASLARAESEPPGLDPAGAAPAHPAGPATVRLYYYTTKPLGLKVLWERRLKIARYADVNDPFELIPFDRSESRGRDFWDRQVEKLFGARHGMICFSDDWRNSTMWSSYGQKHTGICLGFDVLRDCALPVTYLDEPLPPPPLELPADRKTDAGHGRRVGAGATAAEVGVEALEAVALRYKPSAWQAEREWRVRAPLTQAHDGLYFQAFDDGIHLREVILGARCSLKPIDVVQAVTSPPLDVEIFAARAAYDRFAIERHELVSAETITGYRQRLAKAKAVYACAFDDLDDDEDEAAG